MEDIKGMFVGVVQKLSLRITGGDLLRQALASCIENLSLAHYPCHETDTVDLWQAILCEHSFLNFSGEKLNFALRR